MFKIKDAYPKKVCHVPTRHVKKNERKEKNKFLLYKKIEKKRREKDSPYPKKKRNKREMIHTKEFITHPPKIYFHTLADLDQGL